MGLLPRMRERHSGHVINISSIGVQTNPPRFSAYVASKSALDAWTRVVSSECIADNVHFTTIHMPLVKTPMIAPTKLYDRFPTISPEQAAEMIAEAIRTQAEDDRHAPSARSARSATRLFPKLVDQVLSTAYKVFPDSAAARGAEGPDRARFNRAGAVCAVDARRSLVAGAWPRSTTLGSGSADEQQALAQTAATDLERRVEQLADRLEDHAARPPADARAARRHRSERASATAPKRCTMPSR